MSKKGCPPVTVNYDAIVDAAKIAVLEECPGLSRKPIEAEVNQMSGIRLAEPKIDGANFIIGYVTIPTVVNFATKLMQLGVIFPQVDMALSRSIAEGITLLATIASGGKSFLLGSFLGQFPSTMDALADVGIAAIVKARGVTAAPAVKGLGATPDQELLSLRKDLEKLSGNEADEMEGILRVA